MKLREAVSVPAYVVAATVLVAVPDTAGAGTCDTPVAEASALEQDQRPSGELFRARAMVTGTTYGAGLDAGVPVAVMDEAVDVFGRFIDLQHEVRRGDTFEVYWEQPEADPGAAPRLVAATVKRDDRDVSIVRYTPMGGSEAFFTIDGVGVTGLLLRTPVDGAKLTSPFGPREHPILGYTRMHQGVDYAVPVGTAIKAAGDGVVEAAGRNGDYGLYVRIRHDERYETAYAHMKTLAEGIAPGTALEQGDVIGYVGTSGLTTGPHLHYEVLDAGEPVDPATVPDAPRQVLCGTELMAFQWHLALMPLRPANAPIESAWRGP